MAGYTIVLQQVTLVRDSRQFTSNLYKKMGAFCALISVTIDLEPISEHLDPKSFSGVSISLSIGG